MGGKKESVRRAGKERKKDKTENKAEHISLAQEVAEALGLAVACDPIGAERLRAARAADRRG